MSFSHFCGPKHTARFIVRVGFGLTLLFTGIALYRDPTGFANYVAQGLGHNWLSALGMGWGYVLPLLFIVGGILLTFNIFPVIGTWAAGLALLSIPAGLMLKSAVSGAAISDTMPPAMNALIWIIVFMYAVKGTKKRGMCGCGCNCGCASCACGKDGACRFCGMDPCMCGLKGKFPMKSASASSTAKSAPKKKTAMKKSAPKEM